MKLDERRETKDERLCHPEQSEGSKTILSEVCEFIVDCPHSTANDEGVGFPLVRTPNVGKGRLVYNDMHRVSEDVYNQRNFRAVPQEDDLIFAREAPAGNVALIRKGEKVCLGQRTVLLRPNKQKVDPSFLTYYLLAPKQQYGLTGTANGATVAHVNMPTIRNLAIELPDIKVQRKLGGILSAYDNLIENNQKQIKLLEEAAQRLYKQWFIGLRFPGHETIPIVDGLPQGWRKDRADSFFNITIGKTPPRAEKQWFTEDGNGIPWISISDMGADSAFLFETSEGLTLEAIKRHNVKVVPANTVLLSFKLTVGRVSITSTEMCTNEAIAHFVTNDDSLREYTYCYLKNFHYDELGSTSSISKAINSKIVKAMPFVMPSDDIVKAFHKVMKPIFDQIFTKQKQIQNLSQSRDRLLPKLMNGELEV